jgi:hypothetical protein
VMLKQPMTEKLLALAPIGAIIPEKLETAG